MKYVTMVIDLQFGSTGKGLIAGTIAHGWNPDTVVTAWGPNAGHTYVTEHGIKHVTRMLASAAIAPSVKNILIGPGSVLDVDCLAEEIDNAAYLLRGKTLIIHPQTPILSDAHRFAEKELIRVGSTMKGTGAALIEKIRRVPDVVARHQYERIVAKLATALQKAEMGFAVSSRWYDSIVDNSEKMLVEGAQGFSLGIHNDFYPYTTSRDISTAQVLADCRLPIPANLDVVGVLRTFPIRVANRKDPDTGEQVGTSGGYYDDQQELSWEDLGREPELTTVTKLPRRVFTFSQQQVRAAIRVCRPSWLAVTFCDYLVGQNESAVLDTDIHANIKNFLTEVADNVRDFDAQPTLFSIGPKRTDVFELHEGDGGVAVAQRPTFDWLGHGVWA